MCELLAIATTSKGANGCKLPSVAFMGKLASLQVSGLPLFYQLQVLPQKHFQGLAQHLPCSDGLFSSLLTFTLTLYNWFWKTVWQSRSFLVARFFRFVMFIFCSVYMHVPPPSFTMQLLCLLPIPFLSFCVCRFPSPI